MVKKHSVYVDRDLVAKVPTLPPRKRLWDLIPGFLALLIVRLGFNPKPTPYEVWLIQSAALRAYYTTYLQVMKMIEGKQKPALPERNIPKERLN